MLKNKKETLLIVLVIIIAGIVMFCIKGLNYGLEYGENTNLSIYFENDVKDLKNIVTEIFGKENNIQNIKNLDSYIMITVKSANEEQINTLVSKINEKYSLELTKEDVLISNNGRIKEKDIICKYTMPIVISTLLIVVYFAIKYRKQGILKVIYSTILALIGVTFIYFSIYSITRIPVNRISMPIYLAVYIITTIAITEIFEKNETDIKSQK